MKTKNKGKDFCMFALPGMFCFFAVVIVPFLYGVYLTLTDWNGVTTAKNFVGLKNFGGVVKDAQFWTSLLLTFKYVIFVVIIVNVLAFAIAYLLTRGIKGENFFRAGFFTPNLIGGIVLGYIWQFVFSRVFVNIGESTGWSIFEVSWLSEPTNAFIALVVVSVWQLSGYMILIYVAGFMGLSEDVMEAASIDGANGIQKFIKITLPHVKPVLISLTLLDFIWSMQQLSLTYITTGGGPIGSTETVGTYTYNLAFKSYQFSTASASAVVMMLLCLVMDIFYVRMQNRVDG